MRSLPFTLVKKVKLDKLTEEYTSLQSQIVSAADFIREIEKGNLEVKYQEEDSINEAEDQLADSLIKLREQMLNVSLEEKQRNWVAATRSKFIDILRSKNDDLRELANDIIQNLVKCLSANQGGLYLINDDDPDNTFIELLACYAYERKKFISQQIEIGQGLVGQTILEKASTYLNEIPENYLRITSGLGNATPRHLLIVPLKLEENVFGAVEIASFHPIKEFEIEFVEQLGESIASTIANVKNNQRTRQLLEETQQQAEEMRAQEEEVRQNMEELSATQEEMQRIMKEVQGNEQFMNDLINATTDTIFTFDQDLNLIVFNDAFRKTWEALGMKVEKGINISTFYTDPKEWEQHQSLYQRAIDGESFSIQTEKQIGDQTLINSATYSPIRNQEGEITAGALFVKDITETVKAKEKAEKLLEESQQQAEEMKAQGEELRQNMEEITATQEEMQRIMKKVKSKETFLTNLINASSDSIFVIDKDYCLLEFNNTFQAALSQIGMQIDKGGDVFQILSEEERPHHKKYYDRVFKGETFEVTEHIAVTDAHYLSSYSPLKDENGEVCACAVFAKDITELVKSRKQAEELLHESQQQGEELKAREEEMHKVMNELQANEHYLNELLNLTQDTIYTLDKDARVLTYNTFFEETMKQYGFKVEKGLDYLSILPTEEEKKSQKQIIDKVFAGERIQIPLVYEVEDGEIHLISTYSPVRNAKGEIIAAAVYSKDVTELVMAKRKQGK